MGILWVSLHVVRRGALVRIFRGGLAHARPGDCGGVVQRIRFVCSVRGSASKGGHLERLVVVFRRVDCSSTNAVEI